MQRKKTNSHKLLWIYRVKHVLCNAGIRKVDEPKLKKKKRSVMAIYISNFLAVTCGLYLKDFPSIYYMSPSSFKFGIICKALKLRKHRVFYLSIRHSCTSDSFPDKFG